MGGRSALRLLIVAGEASGDAHAARLVEELKRERPVEARGVAGPALARAGVEVVVDMADINVLGFSAVIARLPRLLGVLGRLRREAARFRPHVALLVDSPGFNFRLGPGLRRAGVPVFYYIAPQVWAWHAERARAMAAWVDRLAVVFPFEEPLFREAGVAATFVGHPLLESLAPEVDAVALRHELGVAPQARLVGMLPGSRPQELRSHLPTLLEAGRRLREGRPDVEIVVPLADSLSFDDVARLGVGHVANGPGNVARLGGGTAPALLVRGRTRAVQAHATACAVCSGTATLETALFGTPLVVVYRLGRINEWIARRVVKLRHVGLPNIVAGREVAPERIQQDMTPEGVAAAVAPWLDDPAAHARTRAGLAVVRERLGEPGASRRAAALLQELAT